MDKYSLRSGSDRVCHPHGSQRAQPVILMIIFVDDFVDTRVGRAVATQDAQARASWFGKGSLGVSQ